MINLSRNEIKTILTSFYLWKNTDFSHLDRKFQNKMRSGMKKVEDKLFKGFSELNDDDVEIVRHTLSEFASFLNDPDAEFDPNVSDEERSFYMDLIYSIAGKFSFSLEL